MAKVPFGLNLAPLEPEEEPPVEPVKKKKKMSKAEKKQRKRQRKLLIKKARLIRDFRGELELARKVAKRVKTDWQDVLRESKLIELRTELQVWEEQASYQLHSKDEKIQSLLCWLSEMDDTSDLVQAQLKKIFAYIIDIQKCLTDSNKMMYERSAYELVHDFQNELNNRTDFNNATRLNCENIMHLTNEVFENKMIHDYKIFLERRNNNVDTNINERYNLRNQIVNKMKATQQQLVSFVEELSTSPLDPNKYFKIRKLMDREHKFFVESKALAIKEAKQQKIHKDLQREFLKMDIEWERKINELRLEHSYFTEIRNSIQKKMKLDHDQTMEKIKVVTTESYIVQKKFKKLQEFGDLLLSITATVRRYQTVPEKVLIWGDYAPSVNATEMEDLRKFVMTVVGANKHMDRDNEDFYDELNLMRIFWRRVAIVEAQNGMLSKEKEELKAENKKYADIIRSMGSKFQKKVPKVLMHPIEPQTPEPSCSC